jgi:hypothetical protein
MKKAKVETTRFIDRNGVAFLRVEGRLSGVLIRKSTQ